MTTITETAARPGVAPRPRIASIDIVRGAVMVLMAIDHVRVYSGLPAGGRTAALFFTRWVTHFCAPAFVFLAGTSAFLYARGQGGTRRVAQYLVTRGLMLVALELTVIRLAWTFNLDYGSFLLAGVIWMLGWSMVLMAAIVWLPTWAIAAFGLVVITFQNALGPALGALPAALGWLGRFLYLGGAVQLGAGGPAIVVLYVLVPWIGVMAAGYAFGAIVTRDAEARRRLCLRIGLSATALFLVLGGLAVYTRSAPPGAPPAIFRLLNQQKYPASQLFLLMTLGPTIALLPFAERARGRIADALAIFGRVPLFYYLLHIPLIHAAALVTSYVREGRVNPWLFDNHPLPASPPPDGYTWTLPLLYLVLAAVLPLLYVACRWYADVKARRRDGWLRYL
jgi:uncharacterized membrane protein